MLLLVCHSAVSFRPQAVSGMVQTRHLCDGDVGGSCFVPQHHRLEWVVANLAKACVFVLLVGRTGHLVDREMHFRQDPVQVPVPCEDAYGHGGWRWTPDF